MFLRYPILCLALVAAPLFGAAPTEKNATPKSSVSVSEFDASELAVFERKASLAKKLGATQVPLTDGLPVAKWQFDAEGDPYPAWFIQRPDFFKLFPSDEVRLFVDMEYGKRIVNLLEERC